jgi:hypothetical protein
MGAVERSPVEQEAGETLILEEHLFSSNRILENLEGLTEKVGTLSLQLTRKTAVVLSKSGRERPRLRRLLLVTGSGQPRSDRGGQPQILYKPGTSGTHHGRGELQCLETPQIQATGQDPCLQVEGEAPIFGGQHLSPSSLSSEKLEGPAEKVGTLGTPG